MFEVKHPADFDLVQARVSDYVTANAAARRGHSVDTDGMDKKGAIAVEAVTLWLLRIGIDQTGRFEPTQLWDIGVRGAVLADLWLAQRIADAGPSLEVDTDTDRRLVSRRGDLRIGIREHDTAGLDRPRQAAGKRCRRSARVQRRVVAPPISHRS